MKEIISYEVRVVEKGKIYRWFASNVPELQRLVQGLEGKPIYIFRLYNTLDGAIIKSERLAHTTKKQGIVIKTIEEALLGQKEAKPRAPLPTNPKETKAPAIKGPKLPTTFRNSNDTAFPRTVNAAATTTRKRAEKNKSGQSRVPKQRNFGRRAPKLRGKR